MCKIKIVEIKKVSYSEGIIESSWNNVWSQMQLLNEGKFIETDESMEFLTSTGKSFLQIIKEGNLMVRNQYFAQYFHGGGSIIKKYLIMTEIVTFLQ